MRPLYTWDKAKRDMVTAGDYDEDKAEFHKYCKPNHYFKIMNGYAIQEDIIAELADRRCKKVILHTESGDFWSKFGEWLNLIPQDHGHGKQRILPMDSRAHLIKKETPNAAV